MVEIFLFTSITQPKDHKNRSSWRFFVAFLGWLSIPFKGLSDLQLGDEKVTLNHLALVVFLLNTVDGRNHEEILGCIKPGK